MRVTSVAKRNAISPAADLHCQWQCHGACCPGIFLHPSLCRCGLLKSCNPDCVLTILRLPTAAATMNQHLCRARLTSSSCQRRHSQLELYTCSPEMRWPLHETSLQTPCQQRLIIATYALHHMKAAGRQQQGCRPQTAHKRHTKNTRKL